MNINMIIFRIYIETWTRWAWFGYRLDKHELVFDFGYWTFYVSRN